MIVPDLKAPVYISHEKLYKSINMSANVLNLASVCVYDSSDCPTLLLGYREMKNSD